MAYLDEKQYIAQVDEHDNIIGKVDKWDAHRKSTKVLHRAFTVLLTYNGKALLQHRKHLIFDGVMDFTASSHPIYIEDEIEKNEDAVLKALSREWDFNPSSLKGGLKNKGFMIYEHDDPHSDFGEKELCYLYTAEISTLPAPNMEFAYGYSLVEIQKIKDANFPQSNIFAPWVPPSIPLLD